MVDLEQVFNPLLLSIKVVLVSAVLFLFFGTFIAYILSIKKMKFRWLLDSIVTFPLVFPPIAIGFFLLLLLGENGLIGSCFAKFNITFVFSFSGLVIAGFIAGFPLMVKPLEASISNFSTNIKEAAYISGKSSFETFLRIVLPSIRGTLLASLLIASARAMGEVGITLMLGGNIIGKTDTISLAIYNAVFDGEYNLALILSFVLVVVSMLFVFIFNKLAVPTNF